MTLSERLNLLIQNIGADVKNIFTRLGVLESRFKQVTITVPHTSMFEYVGAVTDLAIQSNSKLLAVLSCESMEFDVDELAQFHLVIKPYQGGFDYCISAQGAFGGEFKINYLIG